MVSFLFNEAQPGLEASSDLGIRSYKGSGFLGQTLPSRGAHFLHVSKLQVLSESALKRGADSWVRPIHLFRCPLITKEKRGYCSGAAMSGNDRSDITDSDVMQIREAGQYGLFGLFGFLWTV